MALGSAGLYILDYVLDILVVFWLSQERDLAVDWVYWTAAISIIPLVSLSLSLSSLSSSSPRCWSTFSV